jgi:hypothetical protein
MEHHKNANQGAQTKWFVWIDLQYAKKSIRSTDRAFHGLQNVVFSFSECNQIENVATRHVRSREVSQTLREPNKSPKSMFYRILTKERLELKASKIIYSPCSVVSSIMTNIFR